MIKNLLKICFVKSRHKGKHLKLSLYSNIGSSSKFEGHNYVGKNSSFFGEIGYASYIANNCLIFGKIGRYCSIASEVSVINGFHPTEHIVSTHPAFYNKNNPSGIYYNAGIEYKEFKKTKAGYDVEIGNDVWIGYGAKIIAGITIGDGAIIGAGAVVTKNVDPYAIVAGVPARIIRYRFTKETIDTLCRIQWWNNSEKWIIENARFFSNADELMKLEI